MTPIHSSAPVVHSVHFYNHDEALVARLSNIIISAIDTGNSVLIVATENHRQQLVAELEKRAANPAGLVQDKRLNLLDAEETLAGFMVNGAPDRKLFFESIGSVIDSARLAAWNAQRGLTVFGEMVAVLWEQGKCSAALELEALWNELLNHRSFHLHCAYPRSLFTGGNKGLIGAICETHSHVLGATA